jgi:outer membrane lipoprotein SlyB
MRIRSLAAIILVPVFLTGCVTTTTRTSTWGDSGARSTTWEKRGRVVAMRETVLRQQGNPAGGAVAGALIGGLFGGLIGGRTHYDRWGRAHTHMSGAGAAVGAVGGAMVGAAASQGAAEDVSHEILVRFDDGSRQSFVFAGPVAFTVGEHVALTPQGLERR